MTEKYIPTPLGVMEIESPDIFQLLVEGVRDYAIFVLDPNGYIRSWNEGGRRIKQYDASEIIGQHFSIFYTPEDRASGKPDWLLSRSKAEGRVEDTGWRVRKDGTHFWADVILTALYSKDGVHRGFAKVTRDMTDRRQMEAALEDAIYASQAKTAFLANMSHELRTPLTAIIGYAEMIDEQLDKATCGSLSDDIHRIVFSAKHLQSVVSDILDLSKIEAGCLELHQEEVDLADLTTDAMETIATLAMRNNNLLSNTIRHGSFRLLADKTRLRQIFYNLLSNAAKFTHNGKIEISAEIPPETPDMVLIHVSDTGVGMTGEQAATVFDRFRQLHSNADISAGGTGLGLAICSMLAKAMNGSISVKSEPGRGSTFTVALPASQLVH